VLARVEVAGGLERLGLRVAESQANFCWVTLPAAAGEEPAATERRVVDGLRKRGVLVRAGDALGRAGCLRITYGTPAENERFLAAMAELLAVAPA